MPRAREGLWPFVLGSMVVHAGLLVVITHLGTVPDIGIEFQLPSEVEFGVQDGLTLAVAEPVGEGAIPPAPEEPSPSAASGEGLPDPEAPPKKKPPKERPPKQNAESAAPSSEESGNAGTGEPVRIPPGAQLALRLDLRRIRESPLAEDVERLMAAIPDWQAVLGGAGIDPLRDLDRVLIASPNLQRSRALFAGKHAGDPELARRAVESLATRKGESAEWTTEHGVPTAPWADDDRVGRRIALLGADHFAVARAEDLPRLLAVAQARHAKERNGEAALDPEAWGTALLSMEPGDALSFEVEGARQFARGMNAHVPTRLRLAARDDDGRGVILHGEARYDSADEAANAVTFWNQVRESYASNPFVAFAGLGRPLHEARITSEEAIVRFEARLAMGHMRLILGYLEGMLARPALQADRIPAPPVPP